jgi:hypothetical protein
MRLIHVLAIVLGFGLGWAMVACRATVSLSLGDPAPVTVPAPVVPAAPAAASWIVVVRAGTFATTYGPFPSLAAAEAWRTAHQFTAADSDIFQTLRPE